MIRRPVVANSETNQWIGQCAYSDFSKYGRLAQYISISGITCRYKPIIRAPVQYSRINELRK